MAITLIGSDVAKEGYEFVYLGAAEECESCKLKSVCNSLDAGSRYRIAEVRKQDHDCPLLDEKVVAVRVDAVSSPAVLPIRGLMEGVKVTFNPPKCGMIGCPEWNLCNPVGRMQGDKVSVVKVGKGIKCPTGERLARVDII